MKKFFAAILFVFFSSAFAQSQPTEFVTQVLEPTGGKILRPKDWFYAEGHQGSVYLWTLSREDTTGNRPYTTGIRIQAFADVKQGTGKSAKQFMLDFIAAKKKEAKVLNVCDETDMGLFTRVCLETEEGPYRIRYSLFWGSDRLDMALVSIAGTSKELWGTYVSTFDKMSSFELIDMTRFPQSPAPAVEPSDRFIPSSPVDAVNLYVIPTDGVSEQNAATIARALTKDTGLWVKSSLWTPSGVETPFAGTNQYPADDYLPLGIKLSGRLTDAGPRTYFIVLTDRDINSRTQNFRFQYSFHSPMARTSVLSIARLLYGKDGRLAANEVIGSRVQKMLLRIVGEMKLGWKRTNDPSDLMYSPIMSIEDVDRMSLVHTIQTRGLPR